MRTFVLAFFVLLFARPAAPDSLAACKPILLKAVQPKWPKPMPKIANPHIQLSHTVDDTGLVMDIQIRKSSGNKRVDQAALDAVRQYRYQPVRAECGKAEVDITLTIGE